MTKGLYMNICDELSKPAILEQCAEECAELNQACLKMARKLRGENPTPKTIEKITDNLEEEIADVTLCMSVIVDSGLVSMDRIKSIIFEKQDRWEKRIKNNSNKKEN